MPKHVFFVFICSINIIQRYAIVSLTTWWQLGWGPMREETFEEGWGADHASTMIANPPAPHRAVWAHSSRGEEGNPRGRPHQHSQASRGSCRLEFWGNSGQPEFCAVCLQKAWSTSLKANSRFFRELIFPEEEKATRTWTITRSPRNLWNGCSEESFPRDRKQALDQPSSTSDVSYKTRKPNQTHSNCLYTRYNQKQ